MSARRLTRMSFGGLACLALAVLAFGVRGTSPGYGSSVGLSVGLNLALVLGGAVLLLVGFALLVWALVTAIAGRR